MYDALISGATIIDGTGSAPYKANVALFGDMIGFIGKEGISRAKTQIDGRGLHRYAYPYRPRGASQQGYGGQASAGHHH